MSDTTDVKQAAGAAENAVRDAAATAQAKAGEIAAKAADAIDHSRFHDAIQLVKSHPLGALATVAAAAAFVEVEFAVGIIAGVGATALLATRSGPEARQQVFQRGKKALAQARLSFAARDKSKQVKVTAEPATPPPA
jgi:hypothetical protein